MSEHGAAGDDRPDGSNGTVGGNGAGPDLERYARQVILPGFGTRGQQALTDAHVAVIGAGGLGSPVLAYLVGAGVGRITVIDDDVVDETNLHRQVMHREQDLGAPKVESATRFARDLNPHVTINPVQTRLTAANGLDVLSGADVVIDGSDNFATRYLADDACAILGIPLVWGAILRFAGQVSVFDQGIRYRDVFPQPPAPGTAPSCAEAGVLGALCGVVGSSMAGEALKLIAGLGSPLVGRLAIFDMAQFRWHEVAILPDPQRDPVTELRDIEPLVCEVPQGSVVEVWSPDAVQAAAGGDVQLLDVREESETRDTPIPAGWDAQWVPTSAFDVGHVTHPGDGTTLVVVCASGKRAQDAAAQLRESGADNVVAMSGGVHQLAPVQS